MSPKVKLSNPEPLTINKGGARQNETGNNNTETPRKIEKENWNSQQENLDLEINSQPLKNSTHDYEDNLKKILKIHEQDLMKRFIEAVEEKPKKSA